jgi:hypothetical protein
VTPAARVAAADPVAVAKEADPEQTLPEKSPAASSGVIPMADPTG